MTFLTRRTHGPIDQLFNGSNALSLRYDLNRIFDNLFSDADPLPTGPQDVKSLKWHPRVSVSETDEEFRVAVELPGMEQEDIQVEIKENTLTLKGEKKFQEREGNEKFHHIETHWGQFERSLPFVQEIDSEKVVANFKNGVLNITLAKIEPEKHLPRKIDIGPS